MANILFTSFYRDRNPVRQQELDLCMKMNQKNDAIHKIYVFLEGKKSEFKNLNHEKVVVVESVRPTYKMFFDLANQVTEENDISIIANTDIFFDKSLYLCAKKMTTNDCFALSRYHMHKDGKIILHNEKYSQDSWIFKGKIRPINYCSFFMGTRGCDNRIAYEIRSAGYNITNPAHSIISVHYHVSESRNYGEDYIPKPYLPVELCLLT